MGIHIHASRGAIQGSCLIAVIASNSWSNPVSAFAPILNIIHRNWIFEEQNQSWQCKLALCQVWPCLHPWRADKRPFKYYIIIFWTPKNPLSTYISLCFSARKSFTKVWVFFYFICIWVTGCRTGKKLTKCHFFFKVRSWYGQIKAKFDILSSPTTSS